jgi:predicted transcriptional regulator of viral defense system
MKYAEFRKKLQNTPFFESRDVIRLFNDKQLLSNHLNRWHKRGLLIKLRRGCYMFNESDRKTTPSRAYLANQLYRPSYVSLEYALSFYDLIPERVADVTSITTKKTKRFRNKLGTFIYQHIKPAALRGYKSSQDGTGLAFLIAEPEKAVIDFLYLNLGKIPANDRAIFQESFRFQNTEHLRMRRLTELAGLFANKKLNRVTQNFCACIKGEASR